MDVEIPLKRRYGMGNGASNPMLILGGIGAIIWLIGAILAVFTGSVGIIVLGIGVLLTSFAGFGLWQRTKDGLAIFMFIMALIGGILLMVGGVLEVAGVGVSVFNPFGIGIWVMGAGQVLFAISLITLGLFMNKSQFRLRAQMFGMDLTQPAMITSLAGGCAALGAAITVTAPAALLLAILFLLEK